MGHEIGIWLLHVRAMSDRMADPTWWCETQGLPLSEWSAAQRRKNATARLHHLCGRFLARHAVSARLDVRPGALEIGVGENGKPILAGSPNARDVYFSISHSTDLAAVAVSALPVGLDVERTDRPVNWRAVSRHCFSSQEADWLAARPAVAAQRFVALWTLKEAYLKALGRVESFKHISFEPLGNKAFAGQHDSRPDSVCRFIRAGKGYVLSVCSLGGHGFSTSVVTLPR